MTSEQDEGMEKYLHSPVHSAIVRKDYMSLKCILMGLPALPEAGEVMEEHESIAAEEKAEVVSSVIDRRDVPGRETPLHLAVKMGDKLSVEMLMAAGADWSLQNEQGWSALQEAVCAREEEIAKIITRYYQTMAWAKWCRRLPRITATMGRMRDFYMEITFNFESSVIPFISRIAPSDTYRIWKRGSNLRADMTLSGFDGFKIQRADQSFLFLGDGSEDGKHRPGSLLVLTHKDKEVTDALDGAGKPPTEAEIAQEVASMSRTNMYRPGIDVTQAELAPQLSWRRQEKTEMVGPWKAKVFDMNNVMVSVKSRRVPGAMSDEELFNAEDAERHDEDNLDEAAVDLLTEDEKLQLEKALALDPSDINEETFEDNCIEDEFRKGKNGLKADQNGVSSSGSSKDEKRGGWFLWSKKNRKHEQSKRNQANTEMNGKDGLNSLLNGEALSQEPRSVTNLASDSSQVSNESRRISDSCDESMANGDKGKDATGKRVGGGKIVSTRKQMPSDSNGNIENEYKKGLKPVLWLTGDSPLKTEELLPLLDILANKVKAVRRLRELLTTKLPPGTFPAKIAIPVVPTIRVVVTFTKFEEWRSTEEFGTPLSSPAHFQEQKGNEVETLAEASSSSWLSWIRGQQNQASERNLEDEVDPFSIPPDYTWVDMNKKKKGMKAKKSKAKRGKNPLNKASECGDSEAEESSGGGNML